MKIVQVNCLARKGSTGRLAAQLAESLAAQGDECRIAYSRGAGEAADFRYETDAQRKVHALQSRITGKQGFYSRAATQKLIAYLAAQQPDVVHLHNLHDNNISLPLLLGYLAARDIPTVITLHDCWLFTGHCCYYSMVGCTRWRSGCGSCPQPRADLPAWFCDASAVGYAAKKKLFSAIPRLGVVGVSDWVTAEARQSLLSGATEILRIYNWVDFSVFYPRGEGGVDKALLLRLAPAAGGKRVCFAAAAVWSRAKGFDDLLALAQCLPPEVHLVLAGALPQNALPQGAVLPPNLTAVGEVKDAETLALLYSAADVFLNFSYQETFGLVSAEALACGTPVLARKATANAELAPPACGALVEPDASPAQAAKALCALLARTDDAMHSACVEYAHSHFSRAENTAQYRALYERLCTRP